MAQPAQSPSLPRVGARPSPAQLRVWRTFLRVHASVTRTLEAELMAEHDLPLSFYDVLVQLSEAPHRRLRMTELADRVLLSRSGLSRLVDRMAKDDLVRRQACDGDGRGMFAVLTDRGFGRLRATAPTHLRGIATHMTDRLTEPELAALGHLLGRLEGPMADPGA